MTSINRFNKVNKSELKSLENFKILMTNIKLLKEKHWGCPWQKIQSHKSLIPYLIEEVYEFINAIYDKDNNNICEELGDILLQIMLHAEISFEEKEFELKDVIYNLNMKIIKRHPYIFQKKEKVSLEKSQEIWENIKNSEKAKNIKKSAISTKLKEEIKSLPSTLGTETIIENVKKHGFKWENSDQIFEKLHEEINELREAIQTKKESHIKEEFGDVYFTLISISNFLKINSEEALQKGNKKFLERFSIIEELAGDNMNKQSAQDFKNLWQIAKKK
tara:strand:- start:4957 stop:5784 length:828 start_codon:yes stop_codon:yes gene_type:complete